MVLAWQYEKINDMKPTNIHHEILLIANTGLVNKQLIRNEENDPDNRPTSIEELEKACWNGILYEMFPEILGNVYPKCQNFLQQVLTGRNFLCINLGAYPQAGERDASIDPYLFMMNTCES